MDSQRPYSTVDMWTFRESTLDPTSLTDYSVEARDGGIGKIDTGPWIFGKKVLLPAGVIDRVDPDTETVFVSLTKDEIKNAPEFDPDLNRDDDDYRNRLGGYYGGI